MKKISYFVIVCLLFSFQISAQSNPYERFLSSYSIEHKEDGKEVNYILDNGWVFVSQIGPFDEHTLFSIDRLVGTRAKVATDPQSAALEIIFENPNNKGHQKTSALVWTTKTTYDSLLTVTDIQINNFPFFSTGYITLSDNSVWYIKYWTGIEFAKTYWANGDHVIVTKKYDERNSYNLVNLDVSGDHYIDFYEGESQTWYSIRDARYIEAKSVKN